MLMLIIFVSKIEIRLSYDRKIVKTAFALIGALVIGLVGVFIKNEVVGLTLNVCAAFIILKRITGFNIPQILVVYCYSLSVIYAIQIVIALAMKCFFADFSVQFTYGVIAQLCGLIVVALLARRLDLRVGYELLDSNRTIKIAGINIFIIFYLLVMKWHLDFSGFLESTIIILLILVVLFIINGLLFKELIEKKNYRDKMMVYEMYLPVIEEMINEVRSKQHDYHNHIQALECLNDKDGLAYKEKLIENITWEKLIVLENEVLMAFLYSKYSLALKEKVLINYDIKSTLSNVKCSDLDLIEMTGILIDNALEATMTMANKEFHVCLRSGQLIRFHA